jgi:hypothetical protein
MQNKPIAESQCHYPDCQSAAVKTCSKCHQGFCAQHVHRRWLSAICEFCLLLKAAGQVPAQRDTEIAEINAGFEVRRNSLK